MIYIFTDKKYIFCHRFYLTIISIKKGQESKVSLNPRMFIYLNSFFSIIIRFISLTMNSVVLIDVKI